MENYSGNQIQYLDFLDSHRLEAGDTGSLQGAGVGMVWRQPYQTFYL